MMRFREARETREVERRFEDSQLGRYAISAEAQVAFDRLMGDDNLPSKEEMEAYIRKIGH